MNNPLTSANAISSPPRKLGGEVIFLSAYHNDSYEEKPS